MNNEIEQCSGFIIHEYDLPYIYIFIFTGMYNKSPMFSTKQNRKTEKNNVNNKSD